MKKDPSFSLNKGVLRQLLLDTIPASQAQTANDLNIGFGFLYYSLARTLRPKHTVVLGSLRGFSPVCFSLGIKDNNNGGKLSFVDVGYSDVIDGKENASGGEGFWKNKRGVKTLFHKFKVDKIVTPYILKTSQFVEVFQKKKMLPIDLLFIDADHRYEGFKYDFETYSSLLSENGVIAFHDVLADEKTNGYSFGIKKYYIEQLADNPNFGSFIVPVWPGLCLTRKKNVFVNYATRKSFFVEPDDRDKQLAKIYQSKMWKMLHLYKRIIKILDKPRQTFLKFFLGNKLFIISNLSTDNWQAYKELRLQALKNAPQAFADSYSKEVLLPDCEWQTRLEQNGKSSWFVFACRGGKLIGMTGAVQSEADKREYSATICHTYVDSLFRKQNVSDELLNTLLKTLQNNKIEIAHLFVSQSQRGAIKLYKRCGFKIAGEESLKLGDGFIHEGLLMTKQLN